MEKVPKKGKRLTHEDVEDEENSEDEERMDMNLQSNVKELQERREQFQSALQNTCMYRIRKIRATF